MIYFTRLVSSVFWALSLWHGSLLVSIRFHFLALSSSLNDALAVETVRRSSPSADRSIRLFGFQRKKRNAPAPLQHPVTKQHLHHRRHQSDRIHSRSMNRIWSKSKKNKTIRSSDNAFFTRRSSEVEETHLEQTATPTLLNEDSQATPTVAEEQPSLRIVIKFLNETQRAISAHPNDTISKVKQSVRTSFVNVRSIALVSDRISPRN